MAPAGASRGALRTGSARTTSQSTRGELGRGSHTGLRRLGLVRKSWRDSQASRRAAFRCSLDNGNGHDQLPLYAPSPGWRRKRPSSFTVSERPEASVCRDCSEGTQEGLCRCRSHPSPPPPRLLASKWDQQPEILFPFKVFIPV